MPFSFRLTSYNILADAYASRRLFPAIDPSVLSWQRRAPALVDRLVGLAPEVICLQEVQEAHWPALQAAFEQQGWHGSFAQKGKSRPDGCAILSRGCALRMIGVETFYFEDGEQGSAASGHLAMIGRLDTPIGLIHIANTHLRWQADTTQPESHIGYREAIQLLQICADLPGNPLATVICGDFNVSPESPAVQIVRRSGFRDAYESSPQPTCNSNGRVKRIDYIFVTHRLASRAEPIPELTDETPMPNGNEPSDHLPLSVVFSNSVFGDSPESAEMLAPGQRVGAGFIPTSVS